MPRPYQTKRKENMDKYEKDLQAFANECAASIPKHLGQSTTPPLSWVVEDGKLRIILADGRGPFRFTLPHAKAVVKAPELMALPVHDLDRTIYPPANLKPNGKHKPARKQAGK
jgi:hypothetical protein